MSPRTLGYLMLLFCSAMAGAGYARLSAAPAVVVADVVATQPEAQPPEQQATVLTNDGPAGRTPPVERAVRVILPAPWDVRTN